MSLSPWKKISEKILFKNPWWTYKWDETELPSGKKGEYHYVHTNGASMIIPILPDGRIIMVKQYRYLNKRESLEFPCGGVKNGHTYEETAHQELAEETGFIADQWTEIGEFNPYNGVTDEICKVFCAKSLSEVNSQPDETEEFEILFLSKEDIDKRITSNEIWDGMTLACWVVSRNKL